MVHLDGARAGRETVRALPERPGDAQPLFGETGVVHAAALATAGLELVQKAVAAGWDAWWPSARPTSLAVALAREAGLGLWGFTRAERTVRYA